MSSFSVTFTGHCPYLDDEHSIIVAVKKTFYPRQSSPVCIPTGFKCEYFSECIYSGKCPIYHKVETNPELLY